MRVNVNSNQYFVDVQGEGEPVVFFHGFTGSTDTWSEIVELLKSRYQCILIDLPGHGKAEVQVDSMEQACVELSEIIDSLSIHAFHLVGYSMGGRTALVFASMFPDRVKKLILESASPGLEGNAKAERKERDDHLAEFIESKGIEAFVDYWETIPLFKSQEKLPESKQQQIRAERLGQEPLGLVMSLKSMGTGSQPNMWPKLESIQMPTLLVTGELDQKFFELNKRMVEALPDAIHKTIPKVGHAPHLENPDFFGKIIMNYL